tara:strand:+ start:3165 stop:3368 length:204 start_codon:yes stop_codon:yes gene_type:complete
MGVPRPTIVVIYKKKSGRKPWLKIFTDQATPDKIISTRSRLLPPGAEILELGIGKSFVKRYKQKYKL